jgi:type IV pilus assembly protein PilM
VKGFIERADRAVDVRYGMQIAKDWPAELQEKDETTGKVKPKIAAEGAANTGWVVEIRGYTYHNQALTGFLDRCLLKNFQNLNTFAAATEMDPKTGKPKVESVIPGMADPIKNNVMYPFLFLKQRSQSQAPNTFTHINASVIDSLVVSAAVAPTGGGDGEAASASGRGAGMGMPSMGSPDGMGGLGGVAGPGGMGAATSWTPVFGAGGGGAAAGAGGMGSTMGMGGFGAPPGGGMGGMSPRGMQGGPGGVGSPDGGDGGMTGAPLPGGQTGGDTNVKSKGPAKTRTEFILIFIWREPTPSDPTPTAGG